MAKKAITGFRFAEELVGMLDGFARFLGVTRTRLVEQAVVAAVRLHDVASIVHNQMVGELVSRYGEDAPVTLRLDDENEVVLLIDGAFPDDVATHLVSDERNHKAYVYLTLRDWDRPGYGSVALGDSVYLTVPTMPFAALPFPPEPNMGLVARLGDLRDQSEAGTVVSLPAEEAMA